ncbi:MAG: response regulator [Acidobacteriota bacterium]
MTEQIRVLVVDDEEVFRDTLVKVLTARGMQVVGVPDGEAALAFLAAHRVDVVVLDLKMPGLDGLEVLRRIGQLSPRPRVVMLTGHGSVQAGLEAVRELARDFLLKPVPADVLAQVIRAAAEAGDE